MSVNRSLTLPVLIECSRRVPKGKRVSFALTLATGDGRCSVSWFRELVVVVAEPTKWEPVPARELARVLELARGPEPLPSFWEQPSS
jgi:hypothetical protein